MWKYEKRLQYPVKISQPNPKLAQFIISQYGGPDGELSASMRYLSQRYSMPYSIAKGTLTDIGSEVAKCSSLLPFFHKKRLPAGRKNANKNICYLEIISSFYTGRPVTA